jgi:hypothetical protein
MKSDPLFIPRSSLVSRAVRYTAWGLSGRNLGILLLLLVLGSLVGSFYLNQASQTTAAGLEIVRLTKQREYWRQENAEVRRQIAVAGSIGRVRARAEELGFVTPEAAEYVVVRSPAPEAVEEEVPSPAESPDNPIMAEILPENRDWWDELVARLESWVDAKD